MFILSDDERLDIVTGRLEHAPPFLAGTESNTYPKRIGFE